LKQGDTIHLLPQLKRDIANIALTKLKMKNMVDILISQQIKEFLNCKLTVEDEIHFLLECPKLDELMKQDMTIYIILRINTKISNLWLMFQVYMVNVS
jgi:hypothetical protein